MARPRKRLRADLRRAEILDAAKDLLAEIGLPRVTARVVAARCGISVGTVTHHFPSMDQLLIEALRLGSKQFTDSLLAALEQHEGAVVRLRFLVDTALPDNADALRNWRLWLEYWAQAAHDPALADMHRERYREWRGAFERTIREGVERGELLDVEPGLAGRELVALFDGLGVQASVGDDEITVDVARDIMYRSIDRLAVTPA